MVTFKMISTTKMSFSRSPPSDACVCTIENAHESDVNVLSWNKFESLVVSGGDDGALNVWSLKTLQVCFQIFCLVIPSVLKQIAF